MAYRTDLLSVRVIDDCIRYDNLIEEVLRRIFTKGVKYERIILDKHNNVTDDQFIQLMTALFIHR